MNSSQLFSNTLDILSLKGLAVAARPSLIMSINSLKDCPGMKRRSSLGARSTNRLLIILSLTKYADFDMTDNIDGCDGNLTGKSEKVSQTLRNLADRLDIRRDREVLREKRLQGVLEKDRYN